MTPTSYKHTRDCDDLQMGRTVRQILDTPDVQLSSGVLFQLTKDMQGEPRKGCQCGRLALQRTETWLRSARKDLRSVTGNRFVSQDLVDECVTRVDALVRERDAIRAELQDAADANLRAFSAAAFGSGR